MGYLIFVGIRDHSLTPHGPFFLLHQSPPES